MITIIERPADIHTAYNPVKYLIDSDNKTEAGFRYIIRLTESGSLIPFAEFKTAPDPTLGGKSSIDISSILKSKVDKFLTFTSNAVQEAIGTNFSYDIYFGESYNYTWDYQDYVFQGIFPGGNTALTSDSSLIAGGTDIPHGLTVGDEIYSQTVTTYGDDRDLLNGYFTVIGAVSPLTVAIDLSGIVISGGAGEGSVRYTDFSKVVNYDLANIKGLLTINAVQGVVEYSIDKGDLADYVLDAPTQRFLTNVSQIDKFYATEEQSLFLNMLNPITQQNEFLYFENNGGDLFRKLNGATGPVKSNSVGPGNLGTLILVSGTIVLIKPDTIYYDVWVGDLAATQLSEKIRIYIDRRCKINDTEILFMDRKGSFLSFAFQNREFETASATRKTYNQYIEDYETYSDGVKSYHIDNSKSVTLNANFMNEDMNIYFEELFTSRYTYVKYEGIWYACTVTNNSVNNERERNNKSIKKSITVNFDLVSPIN